MKKVLISGGAGFIGSNLIYCLNQLGIDDVTIIDRLGNGDKWRNLVGLRFREYFEVDGLSESSSVWKNRYDIVLGMGACSSTRESDASYLMENNYRSVITLAEFALKIGARFIYASSASTYGLSDNQSDSLPSTKCRPTNKYALSKNMVDQTLEARGLLDKAVGLKYFNIVGPNSAHKGVMTDFVAKTYDQIKTTGYATLYDTHTHGVKDARDFLYVKDAVDMTLFFALDAQGQKANGLFNIGSGAPESWARVTGMVFDVFGPKRDMRFQPMPAALRSQYQYYTCADISKLRAAGYSAPITPLDAAIKDYVTQYLMPDRRRGELT